MVEFIGEFFTVYHSWKTIRINGSTEYLHFDPWAENRLEIFTDSEHGGSSGYGIRNFVGETNLKKSAISGVYYTDEGGEINVEFQEFWDEW